MRLGRPIPELVLSAEEQEMLARWARRPSSAQALALRARVVLACAAGKTNTQVSAEMRLSKPAVGKWRSRFVARRLDGLLDQPRPGAPRKISDADVERVLTLTLEKRPPDATHWSTRSMARRSGLSQSAVSRIWRAFALRPHRAETFQLSKDPLCIEKVRDIVGLYLHPLDQRLRQRHRIRRIAPHTFNRRRKNTQDGRELRRYCRRWKIERLFAWFHNFRQLVSRWEYHEVNFLGMLQLGCLVILMRHL